jgi:hypothetical protein
MEAAPSNDFTVGRLNRQGIQTKSLLPHTFITSTSIYSMAGAVVTSLLVNTTEAIGTIIPSHANSVVEAPSKNLESASSETSEPGTDN